MSVNFGEAYLQSKKRTANDFPRNDNLYISSLITDCCSSYSEETSELLIPNMRRGSYKSQIYDIV